jgi:hypothetical protein
MSSSITCSRCQGYSINTDNTSFTKCEDENCYNIICSTCEQIYVGDVHCYIHSKNRFNYLQKAKTSAPVYKGYNWDFDINADADTDNVDPAESEHYDGYDTEEIDNEFDRKTFDEQYNAELTSKPPALKPTTSPVATSQAAGTCCSHCAEKVDTVKTFYNSETPTPKFTYCGFIECAKIICGACNKPTGRDRAINKYCPAHRVLGKNEVGFKDVIPAKVPTVRVPVQTGTGTDTTNLEPYNYNSIKNNQKALEEIKYSPFSDISSPCMRCITAQATVRSSPYCDSCKVLTLINSRPGPVTGAYCALCTIVIKNTYDEYCADCINTIIKSTNADNEA